MKQIRCTLCKQLADGGKFCNHCQAPLPTGMSKELKTFFVIFVLVIGVLWMVVLGTGSRSGSVTAPAEGTNQLEAFVKSQTFMKRQLKAPASADFPYITNKDVSVVYQGNGVYLVNAYVDAQNSFGANIRTHYECKLKDAGDSWQLLALDTK